MTKSHPKTSLELLFNALRGLMAAKSRNGFAQNQKKQITHLRLAQLKEQNPEFKSHRHRWQFAAIHHSDEGPYGVEDAVHFRIEPHHEKKYQRVDSVMFQAFELGASKRRGITFIHARTSPSIGRRIWKMAMEGASPEEITDEVLTEGNWKPSPVNHSRNTKGVRLF